MTSGRSNSDWRNRPSAGPTRSSTTADRSSARDCPPPHPPRSPPGAKNGLAASAVWSRKKLPLAVACHPQGGTTEGSVQPLVVDIGVADPSQAQDDSYAI